MFKGFTLKDWVIGYFTLGIWIFYKMYKNGSSLGKSLGIIYGFLIVVALIYRVIYNDKIELEEKLKTPVEKVYFEYSNDSLNQLKELVSSLTEKEKKMLITIIPTDKHGSTKYIIELQDKTADNILEYLKSYVKEKAEAERLAKEKAEAERLAKEKAEAERIAKEKAEKTIVVSRDELGRVLNRPSKYLGKIIKFKDKEDWDYVVQFSTMDSDQSNLKTLNIFSIEMKGANWSKISQPYLFIPKDIYDKMYDDFYNKTGKNMGDYKMQTNEMELLPMSGSDFNRIFGSSNRYVGNGDSVVVITNIKIYNRDLGTYQTKLINY